MNSRCQTWIFKALLFAAIAVGGLSCSLKAQIVENKTESSSSGFSYVPTFVTSSQTVNEGVGTVTIDVTIGQVAVSDSAFNYTVSGTSGIFDHNLANGTVYINTGQSTAQITFQVLQDALDENDEAVVVTLLDSLSSHTVTIQDDDALPTVTVGAGSGFEGATVDFPVTLSAVSGRDITFNYQVSHTTSSGPDFSGSLTGTFTVPAGSASATLSIGVTQDDQIDIDETFTLILTGLTNAASVNTPVTGTINELVVEDIFPLYGHNWGTYVSFFMDFTCTSINTFSGGHANEWYCPHAGMQKRIRIPSFSSCGNLALTDSLGVFRWVCKVVNNKVEFNINEFLPGKGLRDLVTEAGFNSIKVQLTNGGPVIMESAVANGWWSNPVIPLPDNAGGATATLGTAGAIYVENTSKNTRGYNITAENISVVTAPGVTLTLENATPLNCNVMTGGTASPDAAAMFCAGYHFYNWFEVKIQFSANTQYGLMLSNCGFTRVHGTTIAGDSNDWPIYNYSSLNGFRVSQSKFSGTNVGLYSGSTNGMILEDILVENTKSTVYPSISVGGSQYIKISNVRVYNSAHMGIDLDYGGHGVISNVVVANSANSGIDSRGEDLDLINVLLVNNASGFHTDVTGFPKAVRLVNVTAVNNTNEGLNPHNYHHEAFTDQSMALNSVATNNGTGLRVYNAGVVTTDVVFENIFLGNNTTGMILDNVSATRFFGLLSLGSNTTSCNILNSGANPNVGITHSTCALVTPSTGTLSLVANLSSSFVGKAGTDSVNTTTGAAANTAIAFGSVTDQSNFQNWFRAWGKDGSAYPNSDHRGRCTAGTCNIWDYSLAPADTTLRNVNGVFVDGAACPASVNGENYYYARYNMIYLKYASEILHDGIGNEDGFCQSNEACLFSPHIGAYQGDPTGNYLTHSCIFQDGTSTDSIKGVKMYRLPEL